jgi:hypothetical protein
MRTFYNRDGSVLVMSTRTEDDGTESNHARPLTGQEDLRRALTPGRQNHHEPIR